MTMMRLPVLLIAVTLLSCASRKPSPDSVPPVESTFSFKYSNFVAGDPGANPPKPATVYVVVMKSDPEAGLVEWRRIHYERDRLGWDEAAGTSHHPVFSRRLGKTVTVDFHSGITIDAIRVENRIPYEYWKCSVLKHPIGPCPGPTLIKDCYRTNEVVERSAKGVALHQATVDSPEGDRLCSLHVDWRNSPAAVRELRIREAEAMYQDAVSARLSMNPKNRLRARESFLRLLRDYSDVKVVKDNIDRIKSGAEAVVED